MNSNFTVDDFLEKQHRLSESITRDKSAFLRHVLLLSSTIFGIFVALGLGKSDDPAVNYSFVVAVSLLSLGILLGIVSLYSHINTQIRLRNKHFAEFRRALKENDYMQTVVVSELGFFRFAEIGCYISLSLSIVAFLAYAIFSILF